MFEMFSANDLKENAGNQSATSDYIHKALNSFTTHLITKNFDLTITSVGDGRVTRILKCVDLYMQRKTLKRWTRISTIRHLNLWRKRSKFQEPIKPHQQHKSLFHFAFVMSCYYFTL